mmetsp:Transcript_98240/g.256608  ORF Transcript_98240/g.256608 Transcript_98240/m.256608 type:complete len:258 (-) Transcript_98240:438-1211(-)
MAKNSADSPGSTAKGDPPLPSCGQGRGSRLLGPRESIGSPLCNCKGCRKILRRRLAQHGIDARTPHTAPRRGRQTAARTGADGGHRSREGPSSSGSKITEKAARAPREDVAILHVHPQVQLDVVQADARDETAKGQRGLLGLQLREVPGPLWGAHRLWNRADDLQEALPLFLRPLPAAGQLNGNVRAGRDEAPGVQAAVLAEVSGEDLAPESPSEVVVHSILGPQRLHAVPGVVEGALGNVCSWRRAIAERGAEHRS